MRERNVCTVHGGLAPQVKIAAEERLKTLIHPAISGLAELINNADSDSVRLSAIRDLLDRTGFKPAVVAQVDQEITIRLIDEQQPIILERAHHELSNGRADT